MYSTIVIIFDIVGAVAAVLDWPQPFDKNLEDRVRGTCYYLTRLALSPGLKFPVESDQWDNAEILKRFEDSEVISTRGDTVGKIGNDTFVKAAWNFPHLEASAIDFVQMRTTIPIPRVRRKFKDKYGYSIIVMDYIPGERLDHVWPSLSLWSKLWVALTLRRYIRQLRQIHSSFPGPLQIPPPPPLSGVVVSFLAGSMDSWNRLIPFIADPLFKHIKWMDRIRSALSAPYR